MSDWPVARRLFAVIVAAVLMGVIFGGLRVADAESSAAQDSRVSQLATLGEKLTVLVNDLQNERDETLSLFSASNGLTTLQPYFAHTDAGVAAVQQASNIGGLPANIENDIQTVLNDIKPARIDVLQQTLDQPQDVFSVIGNYAADINDMITLANQVDQGVSDSILASEVQAYSAMALAKEQASEQRGLLNFAFTSPTYVNIQYGAPPTFTTGKQTKVSVATIDPNTEAALSVSYGQEFVEEHAFYQSATPSEAANFTNQLGSLAVGIALGLEQNIFANDNSDYFIDNGTTDTGQNIAGSQLVPNVQALTPAASSGVQGFKLIKNSDTLTQGLSAWDTGTDDELNSMQHTEDLVAGEIATRASELQHAASNSALTYGIITLVVLLIVLLAALVVARSLVLPLRRLRSGALDIASNQLPARVRLLTESPDAATSMEVAPINVPFKDEIGEVARAFDQVHSEAVRLAGEQALLRSTFNAMFVNLSRRSQSLIERLARMIDNLEQNEADPERLGSLFSMDHLVTRMRRNSENLLLLAGHETPSKWSESVPLADVARAAISEIEQYNRVTLTIPPGISVVGAAISDVAHLLAELVENATIFSPKDTPVQVVTQEPPSGGVLIEISDRGIGVSEARLTEMNWRLDHPPVIDVSVSRHMGLFAVARLAERHRVRVRLRPAAPQGLSALVWLPDSIIERTSIYGRVTGWQQRQPVSVGSAPQPAMAARPVGGRPAVGRSDDGRSDGGGHALDVGRNGSHAEGPRTAQGWFRGKAGSAHGAGATNGGRGANGANGGNGGNGGNGANGGGPGRNGARSRSYNDYTQAGLPARTGPAPDLVGNDPLVGADAGTDLTSTGLPIRSPRASLNPNLDVGSGPDSQDGLPQRSDYTRQGPMPGAGRTGADSEPSPQRSADQARSRLAGFQRGTRRAETEYNPGSQYGPGGQSSETPQAGEGSER